MAMMLFTALNGLGVVFLVYVLVQFWKEGRRLMESGAKEKVIERGGLVPAQVDEAVQLVANSGATPLLVSANQRVLGTVRLKDIVKGGMKERFDHLRAMGIRTVMITGDNKLTAAAFRRGKWLRRRQFRRLKPGTDEQDVDRPRERRRAETPSGKSECARSDGFGHDVRLGPRSAHFTGSRGVSESSRGP